MRGRRFEFGDRDRRRCSIEIHRRNLGRTGRNPERNSRRLFRKLADNHRDANVEGAGNRLEPTTIDLPFSDGDATVDLTSGNANADSLSDALGSVADALLLHMNMLERQVDDLTSGNANADSLSDALGSVADALLLRMNLLERQLLFDLTQPTVESRHINSLCCPVCKERYEVVDGTSVLRVKDSSENNHGGGSTTSTQQRNHNDGIKEDYCQLGGYLASDKDALLAKENVTIVDDLSRNNDE
eukprot:scaffold39436_cov40-Cyclotella_meneghiniana.AAC.2